MCLNSFVMASGEPEKAGLPGTRILFDDLHGQSFGNADWTIGHAYSDLAGDLESVFSASVWASSQCACGSLTEKLLESMDCVIIPEPNIRFSQAEIHALRSFLYNGGSMFLIADHGGSDRNFDGWDSSLIFNELLEHDGITFLGDTFTETPLRGIPNTPGSPDIAGCRDILNGVSHIAAWAATSILTDSEIHPWQNLITSQDSGLPFFVCGSVGKGRVAAIGDSSAFDDGTGDRTKNRHSAYHSWLFDQRRLGLQTVAWLIRQQPSSIPGKIIPFPDRIVESGSEGTRVVIDAARGNNDAGIMDRFGVDCRSVLSLDVVLNFSDYSGLRSRDILILATPDIDLSDTDIDNLSRWINNDGGRLIVCGTSARNPASNLDALNLLLQGLNASIRFNRDQIVDDSANTGSPWSLLISRFTGSRFFTEVDRAVFWNSASLTDKSGSELKPSSSIILLAETTNSARSTRYTGSDRSSDLQISGNETHNSGFIVAAAEKCGQGTLIVLGANPLTNFQYTDETEKQFLDPAKWDHRTAQFNLGLINFLESPTWESGNP